MTGFTAVSLNWEANIFKSDNGVLVLICFLNQAFNRRPMLLSV